MISLPSRVQSISVGLWLGLASVQAQGDSKSSLDALHPIQGAVESGRVKAIDAEGKVTLAIGKAGATQEVSRALGDLRSIDLAASAPSGAPLPRQGVLALRSGAEIPGTVRATAARKVTFDSPLFEGQATIGLSHLQSIRFARLPLADDGGFAKYAAAPKEDKDLIYFKTTDKVVQRSVTIQSFEEDSVVYAARGGNLRRRKLKDLYGIVMGKNSGFPPNELARPRVVLNLEGKTWLRGRLLGLTDKLAGIELAEKVTLQVHRSRLRQISVESDRLVFLTDLEPSSVDQVAAFRTKMPWLKNRSPRGEGIELGGAEPRTAQNGLLLPPRTSLTYDIGGQFDFFVATIGIDRRSTGPAHAIFRVLDGKKVLFESKPITLVSEPLSIKVPVDKVEKLTIQADFGKNFDFGDHCVFAEARVIKGS